MDTMWLDRDEADRLVEGIDFGELEYDPDTGLYCLGGEPFTGVSKTRGPGGELVGLSHQRGGVEEGVSVGWHPSGQIEVYSEMEDDVYHGLHVEWDEDGRRLVEERYTRGVLDGGNV